jgi:DNA-binding transcriptional MerR regulator
MHVNLPEKRYYSIGEVAKAFDVKPSLLRFWEKEFEEIQPKKKQSGTRKYTPENVLTIQFIYHLVKEKGLTLQGAKKQLRLKTKENPKEEILAKLENIKAALKLLREKILFFSEENLNWYSCKVILLT